MIEQTVRIWILRHDNLAKAIGLGVVALLLLLLVFVPSLQETGSLRKKISTRSKEEEKLVQKMQVISGMNKEALASRLKVLDLALPPRKDVVLYLATVDGLSRELGLSFAGISLAPGDVTESTASAKTRKADVVKGVHILETEIKINGSRDRIYEFLRVLESTTPLMQIKNVQVSSLGTQDDSYVLSLRLGMLWASRDASEISGVVELFTEKEEVYFQELASLRNFETPESIRMQSEMGELGKFDLFAPIPQQLENPQ